MKVYTAEMFTVEGVEEISKELKQQLETIEYTYNYLLSQIESVKKDNFKELYVYETLKKTNKNLIPDINVLTQYKVYVKKP